MAKMTKAKAKKFNKLVEDYRKSLPTLELHIKREDAKLNKQFTEIREYWSKVTDDIIKRDKIQEIQQKFDKELKDLLDG